jgi:hypothetical protein
VADRTKGTVTVSLTEPLEGLKEFGGSRDWPDFNRELVMATLATLPATNPDRTDARVAAACAALSAFKLADEIEGMLGAQAVALHHASMECLRRAMIPGQPFEATCKLRKDAANMARAMTDMLDAMARKRGGVAQVVRVERVVVHEGGQAIVGSIQPATGARGNGNGEGG